MEYFGDNLTGRIELDGNIFRKCRFKDAIAIYRGGELPTFESCHFDSVDFLMEDAAKRTLAFLQQMNHGGFKQIVKLWLDIVRTPPIKPGPRSPQ